MEITGMGTMSKLSFKYTVATFLSISLMVSTQAWAWGTSGHRTVAEIAFQGLQPATKQRVSQLLGNSTMVSAATWADAVRSKAEWNHTAYYHFEKIEDGKTYLDNLQALPEQQQDLGGVVMAILQAERIFVSKNASETDKGNALRFIIHFVGDIHQPLHTGRPADKGGNMIPRVWNGFQTNLHSIWDSQLIESGHDDIFSVATVNADAKEKVYAAYLQNKFKKLSLTNNQLMNLNVWVDESLAMRPDAYTFMDESEDQYTHRFIDAVDSRVYLAGVRLAAMLNQMVIKEQPPTVRVQLVAAIEKIAGAISQIITLQPRAVPGEEECQENCSSSVRFY